jgi:hypothetical protein
MKPGKRDISKQAMREETDRLIKEAMERKGVTIKQGETRIEAICGKCGAPNRVKAPMGQTRVPFACKECGHEQRTF